MILHKCTFHLNYFVESKQSYINITYAHPFHRQVGEGWQLMINVLYYVHSTVYTIFNFMFCGKAYKSSCYLLHLYIDFNVISVLPGVITQSQSRDLSLVILFRPEAAIPPVPIGGAWLQGSC